MAGRGVGAAALLLACASLARADGADERIARLAESSNPSGRIVRIGLASDRTVTVGASGPFRIVDPATGSSVGDDPRAADVVVVADGAPEEDPGSIFRIQVAAFQSSDVAETERARLEARYGAKAVTHFDPDRRTYRVRVGEATDRVGLAPLLERLRADGVQGIWIAEEPAVEVRGVTLRLVDAAWRDVPTGATRLVAVPIGRSLLRVDGKSYRGVVELRIDRTGRVRPVDWIELEAYLRGVVPSELGPEVWPRLEALKAQAVAARTYAIANLGQFSEDGYDLCATPRCQVYGGADAEHPLSDRAVAATRDEILVFDGKPIAALYTATCGGHTEDGALIFPEQAAPYLKGVPCRDEAEGLRRRTAHVSGKAIEPIVAETGEDVTREVVLLSAVGIYGGSLGARHLAGTASSGEVREWTAAAARASGRPAPEGRPGRADTLASAAEAIARDLGFDERARVLLSPGDVPALLRDPDAEALPVEAARAAAYLAWQGAIVPRANGRFGFRESPSRARLLAAIARIADGYGAFGLEEATLAGPEGSALRLVQGRGDLTLPVAPHPFLFGTLAGRAVPVVTLDLHPGDGVRFRRGREGRIDFLELRPPVKGVADDRTAAVYSWEVRKTRRELEATINRRLSVGTLQDLVVVRRGVSGRIVELRVVGSEGAATVRGFDVRNLLDLRESLVVVEPQRDADGSIRSVVFAGKGWGHGVGLCQVGAYGMAVRGADYRQILTHYYTGVTLGKASSPGEPDRR